jgi:hypothetical protein
MLQEEKPKFSELRQSFALETVFLPTFLGSISSLRHVGIFSLQILFKRKIISLSSGPIFNFRTQKTACWEDNSRYHKIPFRKYFFSSSEAAWNFATWRYLVLLDLLLMALAPIYLHCYPPPHPPSHLRFNLSLKFLMCTSLQRLFLTLIRAAGGVYDFRNFKQVHITPQWLK